MNPNDLPGVVPARDFHVRTLVERLREQGCRPPSATGRRSPCSKRRSHGSRTRSAPRPCGNGAEVAGTGRNRGRPAHDEATEERIAQLSDELASREATIALLLEQVRLSDEAEEASARMGEQLGGWVDEVERRVVGQRLTSRPTYCDELPDRAVCAATCWRQSFDKERRSWDLLQARRQPPKVERLRARFTEVAGESDTSVAAVRALEQENQQLRAAYHDLAARSCPAHEVDADRSPRNSRRCRLEPARRGRPGLQRGARRPAVREHNEHEAELNAMRSQLSRESPRKWEEHSQRRRSLRLAASADLELRRRRARSARSPAP